MKKIFGLVGIYYKLQKNDAMFLKFLLDKYAFLDPNFDKVKSLIYQIYTS